MSDTISRAKAIDGKICIQRSNGVEIYDDYVVPVEYLEQLPPAQPEPKRGRWVFKNDLVTVPTGYYECSECKEGRLLYEDNFCPNCGADMRGGRGMSRLDDVISETAYVLDALMAYRQIVQSGDCNSCAVSKNCEYAPELGELVRYNCPFYKGRVSE